MNNKIVAALRRQPDSIAIFRAIKLGDLMVAIPALRALRMAFPRAKITLISLPWAKEFVARFPMYIDEFIDFPGWPGLPEQPVDAGRTVAFLKLMQQRHFDLALQMQGNGTLVNPMMELLGARVTAGFYPAGLKAYNVNPEFYMPYPEGEHEIRKHLSLMDFLGIPTQGFDLDFPLTKQDGLRAALIPELDSLNPKEYVCIHPGGISARRWPEGHFAQVADSLAEQGYKVVLTGTQNEGPIVESVREQMHSSAVSLAGKTDLGTLAWVLSRASLLVSNDTGVAHLASALKVPSVVIYTTSQPEEWGALNRERHRAVLEVNAESPGAVIEEALSLLPETSSPSAVLAA